eukprot:scaffold1853_cov185-Amphora_coffeaeformis.AAC.2
MRVRNTLAAHQFFYQSSVFFGRWRLFFSTTLVLLTTGTIELLLLRRIIFMIMIITGILLSSSRPVSDRIGRTSNSRRRGKGSSCGEYSCNKEAAVPVVEAIIWDVHAMSLGEGACRKLTGSVSGAVPQFQSDGVLPEGLSKGIEAATGVAVPVDDARLDVNAIPSSCVNSVCLVPWFSVFTLAEESWLQGVVGCEGQLAPFLHNFFPAVDETINTICEDNDDVYKEWRAIFHDPETPCLFQ